MQPEQPRGATERSCTSMEDVQDAPSQGSKKLTVHWKTEWDKKEFEKWKEEATENKSAPM